MSDQQFYVVGVHGAPTPETAPHGFMWRYGSPTGSWQPSNNVYTKGYPPHVQWYPLPAPPTEQAPPPEPVKRWTVNESPGREMARILYRGQDVMACHEAGRAADALNALDRDGVAWGPGRPMEELPETGRVLVRHQGGGTYDRGVSFLRDDWGPHWLCWWPLPTRGEAT